MSKSAHITLVDKTGGVFPKMFNGFKNAPNVTVTSAKLSDKQIRDLMRKEHEKIRRLVVRVLKQRKHKFDESDLKMKKTVRFYPLDSKSGDEKRTAGFDFSLKIESPLSDLPGIFLRDGFVFFCLDDITKGKSIIRETRWIIEFDVIAYDTPNSVRIEQTV